MKKLLSIAFVAGAVCVSCSSNEMESLANDLQTAVDKKEKVKILDLAKEYNLEKAKKQAKRKQRKKQRQKKQVLQPC